MRVLSRSPWAGDFITKRIRHLPEQVIRKLKTAEQLIAQGKTVEALRALFRVSARFACRVVGQHRSTQHWGGRVIDLEEAKVRRCLREIAAEPNR